MTAVLRPIAALLALAGLVPLLTTGCSDGGDTLTVYSGRTENLIGPLLDDFEEETGIDVEPRYGDSAELALLLSEEGDRTPADVFISQNPGAIAFVADEGLLAEVDTEVLELVGEENRASDGTWVGLSGRKRVLVYNTDMVDPDDLPDSVLDLTAGEYAGEVAIAPSNGSFQDFVTAMRQELGDDATFDWLTDMAAGGSPTYANNTAIVEAVGRGEVPMGLVNHYYNHRALDEDPDTPSANHHFASDDVGSLVIVTGAGILEPSDQKEDARELVEFLLGEQAQTFFSAETFEYPLAAGVEPAQDLPPLEGSASEIDFGELGGGLRGTVDLIDRSGLRS